MPTARMTHSRARTLAPIAAAIGQLLWFHVNAHSHFFILFFFPEAVPRSQTHLDGPIERRVIFVYIDLAWNIVSFCLYSRGDYSIFKWSNSIQCRVIWFFGPPLIGWPFYLPFVQIAIRRWWKIYVCFFRGLWTWDRARMVTRIRRHTQCCVPKQ